MGTTKIWKAGFDRPFNEANLNEITNLYVQMNLKSFSF
jgi:hypothetical protein